MSTRYYFSWFNDFFPKKLVQRLHEDMPDRKSLVLISAQPTDYQSERVNFADISEWRWLNQADLLFEECHFIDYRIRKEEANRLIANASVVFLCGGDPIQQHRLLQEYELREAIRNSDAVLLSASAGSLNLSAAWLSMDGSGREEATPIIYEGIGLDRFACETHSRRDYATFVQGYLFPLSEQMDVYASEQESAIRVQNDRIDVIGSVYLVSGSNIQKMTETL